MSLRDLLIDASQKYYTDGSSPMSDAEFDAGMKQLAKENPDDPILTAVGHGYEVELDNTPGEKFHHLFDVGSITKCYDLKSFDKLNIDDGSSCCYASLKYDGISVVLYYKDGRLEHAVTRGKDNIGIDITSKVTYIHPEWYFLSDVSEYQAFTGAVRGEILMRKDRFQDYLASYPEAKNPRNTTAGLINGKEVSSQLKYLDIILYRLVGTTSTSGRSYSYSEGIDIISKIFGEANTAKIVKLPESYKTRFEQIMGDLVKELSEQFPYDGIVITNDASEPMYHPDCEYAEMVNKCAAFKFEAESCETVVKEVVWTLSKSKYLVPRINVEPISLSGTNVQFATGFNAEFIYKYKICPGKRVMMLKSNEIIPIVIKVFDEESDTWINCSERYQ